MKSITIILLLLFSTNVWGGFGQKTVNPGLTPGLSGVSSVVFHWGAENSYLSNKPNTITGTANSDPVFSSSVVKVGTYSFHRNDLSDNVTFNITGYIDKDEGQIGFWYYPVSTNNVGHELVRITDGGSNYILISKPADAADLAFNYHIGAGNQIVSVDANLSFSNWYYIIFKWIPGAGSGDRLFAGVYDTDGSLVISGSRAVATTAMSTDPTSLILGTSNGNADSYHFDNFIIDNSFTTDVLTVRNRTGY